MRVVRSTLLLLLALLIVAPGAEAGAEEAFREAKEDYQSLLQSPGKQRYRDQWEKAIEGLVRVREDHPRHPRAASALYLAGKAARGMYEVSRLRHDARRAIEFYTLLEASYPESNLADDALLLAAAIEEEIFGDQTRAYALCRSLCERYPGGDMAPAARKKMGELARFAPPPAAATDRGAAELKEIRHWSRPEQTRVVLDLGERAEYSANALAGDPAAGILPRIYVDLSGVRPAPGLADTLAIEDGILKSIRTGRPDGGKIRVVLDLARLEKYEVFALDDPFRIVIDVAGVPGTFPAPATPAPASAAQDGIAGLLARDPGDSPLKVRIPPGRTAKGALRVVVDAGHGGKDPGAVGPNGVLEKDVTLAIAKDLARSLEKELGCEVILTRDRDVYLELAERTGMANRVGADLFISIHANANKRRDAYGVETFYLNFSKNDKAVDVVARENGMSLKEVGDLELILFDLMANSKINESSRLAADIQKTLVEDLGRHYSHIRDLGVRQGPFYVLLGATMPSVLVETAFISNKREEARLKNRNFQKRTAEAITRGVRSYAIAHKLIATK